MKRIILALLSMAGIGALMALAAVFYVIHTFSQDLPDYSKLARYEPPISTRIHAADGRLIEEFAVEKRVFVPVEVIPKRVIESFLAAEDRNFYHHPGVDFTGVARAMLINLKNYGSGRTPVGGSTITQQVAKNFLLGNEKSYKRKIREALISFRIEKTFSKDQILELYLNEIYLGKGRYGAAAAAMGYFDKSLDELDLAESAYLAVLPKAPNNYQVENHLAEATERRNWVLSRMYDDNYITEDEMKKAQAEPIAIKPQTLLENVDARYFDEDIRRDLINRYGENALYEGGLSVRSTLDPYMQEVAAASLTAGLVRYDRRHGYRGPVQHLDTTEQWTTKLPSIERPKGSKDWLMAIVLDNQAKQSTIGLIGGTKGTIPLSELTWARKTDPKKNSIIGGAINKPSDALQVGDVILVKQLKGSTYKLMQIPKAQGGIIVMDPHTGRILAMQGGFDFSMSEFNRASQAMRQPGSSFKPFVYLAALNNGFTPSNLVLDRPVEFSMGKGQGMWRPENYEHDFLGLIPMSRGLELSRNTMTVRLADHIGMKQVVDISNKFHISDNLPPYLAMALGAGDTTLMRMVTGYGMFVNGGKDITPTLIDRIQDRHGKTIYRHDTRVCPECGDRIAWKDQAVPIIPDNRAQVTDPRTAYQLVSMLEGVVQRGTGTIMKDVARPVAAKTGTTSDYKDAWFIAFTPDLVVGTYVGFDNPSSLGAKETGARAAAPIVRAFMKVALDQQNVPPTPFRIPEGVSLVRINPYTGQRTDPTDAKGIWEAFIPGTEPGQDMLMLNDNTLSGDDAYQDPNAPPTPPPDAAPDLGTGGLY